jgi:hypothetical protein
MGAEAFTSGNHVAFAGTPSLHTAAHEAAHVVQQRAGIHLKGGVGQVGDEYEKHADAVADRYQYLHGTKSTVGGFRMWGQTNDTFTVLDLGGEDLYEWKCSSGSTTEALSNSVGSSSMTIDFHDGISRHLIGIGTERA